MAPRSSVTGSTPSARFEDKAVQMGASENCPAARLMEKALQRPTTNVERGFAAPKRTSGRQGWRGEQERLWPKGVSLTTLKDRNKQSSEKRGLSHRIRK